MSKKGVLIDLTGKNFNGLTVIKKSEQKSKSGAVWDCLCGCGATIPVTACNLKSGNTHSCGCISTKLLRETREKRGLTKDLIGKTFSLLTVIEKAKTRSGTNPVWICVCKCGNQTEVIQENLLNGHTTSCGCNSSRSRIGDRTRTHDLSMSRIYGVWRSMKARCENPNTEQFINYGGRGIGVCVSWHNFQPFYEWAMSHGYDTNAPFGECTIDRINVNGNYCPENCRWANAKTQALNKRKNRERNFLHE